MYVFVCACVCVCEYFQVMVERVEENGLVRVTLSTDRKLFYINEKTIEKNLKSRNYDKDLALRDIAWSDLTPGSYEGECISYGIDKLWKKRCFFLAYCLNLFTLIYFFSWLAFW